MLKVLRLINSSKVVVLNLPTPSSISYNWGWGSILGLILLTQIVTGLFISFFFSSSVEGAFGSVVYLMREVQGGWVSRAVHANGANLFFVFIYMHMGRGLYYYSWINKWVWGSGVILLLILMMVAFLGYVLPWGQSSYWGVTVITNLVSSVPYVGSLIVTWLWGDFTVAEATLRRFYSLHFVFPFILVFFVIVHLFFLHEDGSSSPTRVSSKFDVVPFHPFFTLKDLVGVVMSVLILSFLSLSSPWMLSDADNFSEADFFVTPEHIQPEWYFLFAYAILRSIPSKLGGVVGLIGAILILLVPLGLKPFPKSSSIRCFQEKLLFWSVVSIFSVLTWVGGHPVESPYEGLGQIFTLSYFSMLMLDFLVPNLKLSFKE